MSALTMVMKMVVSREKGADRSFALPKPRLELIRKVTSLHDNVVVVVNAGGGIDFSDWGDKVKSDCDGLVFRTGRRACSG